MSLKLLIDEDAQDKVLVKLLRQAGHEVITVNEAGVGDGEEATEGLGVTPLFISPADCAPV